MNLSSSAQSPTGMLPEASFPLRLNDIVSNMRVSDFYLLELSADRLHSNNNTTTAATATGGDGNGTRKPFPTASSTFWLDEHHMVSSSELAETAATTTALPGNRNHGGGGIGRAMMDWTTLDDSMRSSSSPVSTTSSTTTTTTTAAAAAVGIPTAATDDIEVLSSTRQWGASPPPPQSLHNSDGTLTTTLTTVGMGHGHALQPVHTTATSPTSTAARSWQKSSGTSVVVARTSLLSEQRAVGGQPVVLPDLRQLYGTDLNIPPPNLYTEDPDHCLHMSLPWHPVTSAFSMVDLIASRTEEEAHEQQHDQRDLLDHGPVEGDTLLDPHAQATPSSRAASQGTTANEPVALSSVLPPLPRPRSHATAAGDEQQAPNPSSPPPDVVCNVSQLKQLIVAQQLGKPLAFMAHRVGPSLVLEGCASGRPMYDNPREARNKELATKLLYYSVLAKSRLDGTPQTSDAETPTAVPVAIGGGSTAPAAHKTQQQLHHPNFTPASVMTDDDDDVLRKVDPMFRKTAQWRFNDLEILLGINTATVLEERSGKELSLCVRDAPPQPFPRAEALECWLDCVMANIDGVAICYHTDGIVQGYQVVPTAKIPQLSEGAPFEPVAVQREAGNILKWLTSACHKNGGSYVVLKDPQSPLLRLYDLSEFMAPTTNTATSNSTAHGGGGGGVPSASSASSSLSPLLTSGGDAATSNTTTTYAVASTSPSSAYHHHHHHHHHHSTHLHHSTSSATATTTLLMLEDIPQPLSHSSPKKHPTQRGQEGNERDAQTQHLLAIEEDEEEEERKLPRPSAQPLVDAVLTNELGVALTTTTTTTTTTAPSSYRGDNAEQELQRSAYRAFFHQFTYPMAMMCLRMAVSLPNSDAETLRLYQRSIQLLDQSALHHCADEEDGSSDDDDHDDDGEDEEGGAANHRDKTNNSTGDTGTTTNRTRSNTASSPSSSKRTVEAGGVAFALAKCHEQCMLHFHSSSPLLDAEAQCVAHAEGALSAVFRALGQLKRDRALLLRNRTANETAGDDKATATAAAQAEWTLWKAKEREMEVIASEVLRCVAALANQRVRSKLFAEAMEAIAVAKSGVHLYRQFVDAESLGDEKHATEREEDEEEKGQEQERRARETKLQSVLLQLSTIFGELLVMLARELPSSLSSTLGTSSQASQTPPPRHQESTALVVSSAASKTPQQLLLSSFQQRVELAVRSVNSHVPLRLRVRLVDVATSETTSTSQQSSPSLRRSATSPSPHELEKKEEGDAAAASVATDLTALVHDFNHLLRLSLTASKTKEAVAVVKEEEKTATAMLRAGMDDMTTFSDPLLDRAVDVFSFAVRVAKRMDVAEAELQRKLASILADRGNQFVAQANAVPPQPENPSDPAAASSSNTVSARQTVACLTRAALYFQQSSHAFQEMSDVPNTLMTALNASKMQVRLAQLQSQLLPVTPARQPQATEEKDKETADDDAANGESTAAIRPTAATLEITRRETALLHEAIHVLKQALMWAVDTTSMTTPATTTSASSSSSSSSSVPQVVATAATLEAILLAKAQLVNLYIVGFQRWFPSELPSKRRLCVQNLWNLWHATFPTSSHSSSPWKRIEELVYATYLLPALRAVRLGEQHPSGNSGGSSGGGSQALFDAAKADAAVLRCMVSLHGRVVGLVPCIPPPTTANEEKEDSSNSNSINHNNFLIIARTIETLWTAKTSLAEQVQSARYLTDRSRQLLQLTEHSCVSHLQTLLSSLPLLLHEERGGERGGSSSGGGSSAVAASSEQASSLSAPQMQYQQKWTVVLQNSAREWEAYFVGLQQLLAGYVFLMQHAAVVVATAGSTAVTSSSPSSVSGQTTSSPSQDEDSEQVALDLISRALTSYCSVEPVLRRAVAVQERVRDCLQELEDYRRGLNNSGSSSGASKATTKASKNGGGAAAAAAPLRNNKNLPNNRKEPFDAAVTALLDAFRGSQSSSSSSASSSTTTATTRMAVPTFEESVLRHPKALTAFQQCHSSVSAIVLRLLKTMGSSTASSSSAVEKKKKEQDLRAAARQALTLASSSTLQQKEERQGGVSSSSSSSNVPSLWEDAALLIRSLSLLFDGKKTKQSSKYL